MRKHLALFLALVLALGCFAGCVETENASDANTPSSDTPSSGTSSSGAPADPTPATISIEKALELCGDEAGYVCPDQYYIRGTVASVKNLQYGQMEITDGTYSISVYGITGYSEMADKPYKGDEVLLLCVLQNYNGTKEIKSAELVEFKHS